MPLQAQPSVTVAEHYDHEISEQVTLPKPLPDDLAKEVIASPYLSSLLYHGIMKFYKSTDTNEGFAEHELLQKNSLSQRSQPELEGKHRSTARVEELVLEGNRLSITYVSTQTTPRSAFSSIKLTYTYDCTDPQKPTFSVLLLANGNNITAVNLARITYKQYLHRIAKLAADPSLVLDELRLISRIAHRISEKTNFHGLPHGVMVQFTVPCKSEQLIDTLQQQVFLKQALPRVTKVECNDTSGKLQTNDKVDVTINNMKVDGFNLVSAEQQIVLSVVHSGNKDNKGYALELLSNKDIYNFDQLGYGIVVSELGDQTSITLGVYYNHSNLVAIADFFKKASSILTDAVPDTKLFLHFAARGLLETFFKRFCEHLNNNLKIDLAQLQIIDLSPLPTNSSTEQSTLQALRNYLGFISGSSSRTSSRRGSIVTESGADPKPRSRSNSLSPNDTPTLQL